jgi:hypothetical protein
MFFALSHAVTVRAILSATGMATDVEAVEAIKDEALDGAEVLLTFFEQLIIAPDYRVCSTHTRRYSRWLTYPPHSASPSLRSARMGPRSQVRVAY